MTVYRIGDSRHPLFDGTGAFLNRGRWNSRGNRVIYAAATYAGALLEQLAHSNIGRLPGTQAWIAIEIPGDIATEHVQPDEVPGWTGDHMGPSRKRGDRWLKERRSGVLIVPSAVTAGIESNVLINPEHPDFPQIRATAPQPIAWDPRLLRA